MVYDNGVYKILGRLSVDIIKNGGYKISALDVERMLLQHEDIVDVSVVGLPDQIWGQKIAAVLVTKNGINLSVKDLKEWGKDRMPPYYIPTVVHVCDELSRNAMGKVNKKQLTKTIFRY